jgi:hypothetical protein
MRPNFGNCRWCGKRFKKRSTGKERLFCSDEHKWRFDAGLRAHSILQLAIGQITVEDLKLASKRLSSRSSELALTTSPASIEKQKNLRNSATIAAGGGEVACRDAPYMGAPDPERTGGQE